MGQGRSILQKIGGKGIIRSFILVFVPEYYKRKRVSGRGKGDSMGHVQMGRKVYTKFLWRSMKKDAFVNLGSDMKILLKRITV